MDKVKVKEGWQGGDVKGTYTDRKSSVSVRYRGEIYFYKSFRLIGGDRERAKIEAEDALFWHAFENRLLKNQFRYVRDLTSGNVWLEMKLKYKKETLIMKALVEALPLVEAYTWCATWNGKNFYAMTTVYKDGIGTMVYFHQLVMEGELKDGFVVDHIYRKTLDNRKYNLRMVTRPKNGENHDDYVNNTSDINGVHESGGYWVATWRENKKPKTMSFSIDKYGYERAKALAAEFRETKEKEFQFNVHEPPVAPSPQVKRAAPARSDDDETKERPAKKQRLLDSFLIPK